MMQFYELAQLIERQSRSDNPYLEFLRVPALNCGLYVLPAGEPDPQKPHDEDEVYYVISGRGRFRCKGEDIAAGPGSIIYVAAGAEHYFHDIAEDLTVLVFFAAVMPAR